MIQSRGSDRNESPDPGFKKYLFDDCVWLMLSLIVVVSMSLSTTLRPPNIPPNRLVALGSVLFLYYVLATVPPAKVKNKITNSIIFNK